MLSIKGVVFVIGQVFVKDCGNGVGNVEEIDIFGIEGVDIGFVSGIEYGWCSICSMISVLGQFDGFESVVVKGFEGLLSSC